MKRLNEIKMLQKPSLINFNSIYISNEDTEYWVGVYNLVWYMTENAIWILKRVSGICQQKYVMTIQFCLSEPRVARKFYD